MTAQAKPVYTDEDARYLAAMEQAVETAARERVGASPDLWDFCVSNIIEIVSEWRWP